VGNFEARSGLESLGASSSFLDKVNRRGHCDCLFVISRHCKRASKSSLQRRSLARHQPTHKRSPHRYIVTVTWTVRTTCITESCYHHLFQRDKSHHRLIQPPLLLATLLIPLTILPPDPLIDYPQRLLSPRRCRQVFVPVRRDQNVVLDPHPAHGVVFL
jgi:hypothetical protein